MKYIAQAALTLALLIGGQAWAYAQGFTVEEKRPPSPSSLTDSDLFVSLDGRFSIALPRQVTAYTPLSADTPSGRVTYGDSYNWQLEGVRFDVATSNIAKPPTTLDEGKSMLSRMAEGFTAEVSRKGGKLLSNTEISLSGNPGRELKFESSDAHLVSRTYVNGPRLYQVMAISKKEPELQQSLVKILDSFKLLSSEEVEAARRKKIAEATPPPLPQEPVAKKLKSDAEDEGLKGAVKTVFIEREDLSGTWVVGKRKPSSMEYYNEQGNRTKVESYDYKGNLFEVSVYGYIDGKRVTSSKTLENEYDPPSVVVAAAPGQQEEPKKYDERYDYMLKYMYDDKGRLAEETWYSSDDSLWQRYVYKYKGAEKETLVYDENGKLNRKLVAKLDDKGSEVEESYYDLDTGKVDEKHSYTYEYDAKGNWTKKTEAKWVTKDGKPALTPDSVTYRTITYY